MYNNNDNNNFNNNPMISRGIEFNPFNLSEEMDVEEEWAFHYMESFPQNIQQQIQLFDNIPDEDDFMSETTTVLMDDSEDDEMDTSIQEEEITSSTPTIATLNAVNTLQNKRMNVWILQPALNSIYNSMNPVPSCHSKQSTGDYQMNFIKEYDNALMTPLVENTCLVQSRDRCALKAIQSSLFHLMISMKNYPLLKPTEKESIISNFNYLAQLVTTMEAGLKAQREWNTVMQSLRHHSNHQSSISMNLDTIDLPYMVKRTTQKCSELTMNDQIPMTTLFDQYQKPLAAKIIEDNNHRTQEEMVAHRMFMMITEIQEMLNEINNNNTDFM